MDLAAWVTPSRTALLVVDMQVDFASPQGVLGQAGVDLSPVPAALAAAEGLAAGARNAGVAIAFAGLRSRPETDSLVWSAWRARMGDAGDASSSLCRAGSPGAAFVGPVPEAGETVIFKTRYSPFFRTDLEQRLRDLGVDTLVICGLTTECCVACAARDAFERDFHVFLAADACAAYGEALHDHALTALALNCATVVEAADVLSAWAEH